MSRTDVEVLTGGLTGIPALVFESLVSGKIEGNDTAVGRADAALRKARSVAASGRSERQQRPATAEDIRAHQAIQARWADLKAARNRAQSRAHSEDTNKMLAAAHRRYAQGSQLVQEGQALQTAAMIEVARLATDSAALHDRHARGAAAEVDTI